MIDSIDGIEAGLCASAPASAFRQLQAIRVSIDHAHAPVQRRRCERRLNRLADSQSWFRAAAKRHLTPLVARALVDSTLALARANAVLRQAEMARLDGRKRVTVRHRGLKGGGR